MSATPPASAARSAPLASSVRQWLAARTLRGRLVAGLLVLLALACASVGAVTYAHLHSVLTNNLNSELQLASMRYVDCLQGPPPGSPNDDGGNSGGGPQHSPGPGPCAQQQNAGALNAVFSTGGTLLAAHLANSDVCRSRPPTGRCLLACAPAARPATSSTARGRSTSPPTAITR